MPRILAAAAVTVHLAIAGCAADAPQPVQVAAAGSAAAAASAPAGQVCTRETKTGSHVATTVCRPASDGNGGVALDSLVREDATTLNRTNGGFGR